MVVAPSTLADQVLGVIALGSLANQILGVVGLTLLSGIVAMAVAIAYRWYFRERVPTGVALLAGVSAVAIYLNTRGALGAVVVGEVGYLTFEAVVFNTAAFLTAGLVAPIALRAGDRIAISAVAVTGVTDVEGDVSRLVTTVGRRTAVTLPERIDDIEGYDPVASSVTESLAGRTFIFPRGLTVEGLRDRLTARLKADFEVGYVDVDLTEDAIVEYLAVGQRVAGIGPTLGPGAGAVAIRADPPNAASPGDLVQVWQTTGDAPERVTTAEIRGIAGDVVTLALDEHEARELAGGEFRLLTMPVQSRPGHEFAGLLRAAEETMASVSVEPDTGLVGTQVSDLDATVVAIKPAAGPIQPIPPRHRELEAGDRVYIVARPAVIRQLGAESTAT